MVALENPKETAQVVVQWLLELKAELDKQREQLSRAPTFLPYGTIETILLKFDGEISAGDPLIHHKSPLLDLCRTIEAESL